MTPYYDITFRLSAEAYKRGRKTHEYEEFQMFPADTKETIVCFGRKDYVPVSDKLNNTIGARKIVFYNSARAP